MNKLTTLALLFLLLPSCEVDIQHQAQAQVRTHDTQVKTELVYGPIDSEFTPIMLLVANLCLRQGEVDLECVRGSLEKAGSDKGELTYDALIEASKEY